MPQTSPLAAVPQSLVDAGLWAPPAAAPAATPTPAAAWLTWPAGGLSSTVLPAVEPEPNTAAPQFVTLALDQFDGWLQTEAARPVTDSAVIFPRLELPVGEPTRQFLKSIRQTHLAAWLDRIEATAQATGQTPARGLLLIAAADYTRAALDLRHLIAAHCPRKGRAAGRRRLALILDFFGVDRQGNWQAGPRLGDHYPVFVLARGIPGKPPPAAAGPPPAPADFTADPDPEAIYHGVVGELGTERILFGSGATAGAAESPAALAAAAAWFAAPRPWLDADSLTLLFGGNAGRLLAADPASLDPAPLPADREALEIRAESTLAAAATETDNAAEAEPFASVEPKHPEDPA